MVVSFSWPYSVNPFGEASATLSSRDPDPQVGVVRGDSLRGVGRDLQQSRHHTGHLGRRVELALALAGLGGEVPHEVLVGVADQVIALGAGAGEVQVLEDTDEPAQPIHQLLALAELVRVVEVRVGDDTLKGGVGVSQSPDGDIGLLADVRLTLEPHQVVESAARRHGDVRVPVGLGLVGDILHEQQGQHVVLVLAGVHATAQLIGPGPQRAVQIGLLQSHRSATTFSNPRKTQTEPPAFLRKAPYLSG